MKYRHDLLSNKVTPFPNEIFHNPLTLHSSVTAIASEITPLSA